MLKIKWKCSRLCSLPKFRFAFKQKSGPKAAQKINIKSKFYLLITFTVLVFPSA